MIVPVVLIAAAAVALPVGPGLRLGLPLATGLPQILVLDHKGKVASRVTCIRNQWVNPDDAAAKLIASLEVAATVLALDGKLTEVDQLGPSKFDCLIIADQLDR